MFFDEELVRSLSLNLLITCGAASVPPPSIGFTLVDRSSIGVIETDKRKPIHDHPTILHPDHTYSSSLSATMLAT